MNVELNEPLPDDDPPGPAVQGRCPSCGAVVGGRAGCQALFDELGAQAWSDPQLGAVHNLVVDAYSMQHPEEYCRSPKSYAAHLTGLCCALEFGADPKLYWGIPRWLNGSASIHKPPVPTFRGAATVADVRAVRATDQYQERVRAWARDVWQAYALQQDLARHWMNVVAAGGRGPAEGRR